MRQRRGRCAHVDWSLIVLVMTTGRCVLCSRCRRLRSAAQRPQNLSTRFICMSAEPSYDSFGLDRSLRQRLQEAILPAKTSIQCCSLLFIVNCWTVQLFSPDCSFLFSYEPSSSLPWHKFQAYQWLGLTSRFWHESRSTAPVA
ncbi:hypothetical protein C4K38_4136 [Pseudomonas chlororaphis subsp. piscium]|nr:hypothetical protein C4K38_4136 [Pseudomonas chlororaphis subsp. piscium]